MHFLKKLIVLIATTSLCLNGCGLSTPTNSEKSPSDESVMINIAYQYGLSYAPLVLCKEQGIIEKNYFNKTGKNLIINWSQMSSGPDINTAFASGDLDVACMGIAPAITGISNKIGYKIFTNISGQEHGLMSNDASINSLEDYIGSNNQIALVNIGSIQHIILAMSLVKNGYDAHALDANIVGMKHPDGKVALESNSISGHLTSNPYIYMERENSNLHELNEIKDTWSVNDSFIVGVASEELYSNTELYSTVYDSISEAIDILNSNPEDAAQITCELDGNSLEDELQYMKAGSYSTTTSGILDLANFMYENQFISEKIDNYSDLTYDNVVGD